MTEDLDHHQTHDGHSISKLLGILDKGKGKKGRKHGNNKRNGIGGNNG